MLRNKSIDDTGIQGPRAHEDLALIRRLKKDDQAAFRLIFYKWSDKLFAFCFRFLKNTQVAEEIVQETLIQLWINRTRFDEQYPISPYLFAVCRRLALNELRRASVSQNASSILQHQMVISVNSTEDDIALAELDQVIEDALALMPKQQRQVYRLSRQRGRSLNEIAAEMGILKNTVKKHLSEALKALRIHHSSKFSAFLIVIYTLF